MNLNWLNVAAILLVSMYPPHECSVFFVDVGMSKVVELRANNEPCTVHQDRRTIQNILTKFDTLHVQTVGTSTLNDLSNSCGDSSQINRRGGFIFPGTKWCGPGNVASTYNDLGYYTNEDRCCRDHDHCPNQLEPGQCRHGICNISPFTRSHCECDETFRRCLRDANSDVANILGTIYFNIAQGSCFRERRYCTPAMRENMSYSWYCDEWKFEENEMFAPTLLERPDGQTEFNTITGDLGRAKTPGASKINPDLQTIFGKDEDVTKIMKNVNV